MMHGYFESHKRLMHQEKSYQEMLYSSENTTLGNSLANGHCHVGNELVPHYFFLSLSGENDGRLILLP